MTIFAEINIIYRSIFIKIHVRNGMELNTIKRNITVTFGYSGHWEISCDRLCMNIKYKQPDNTTNELYLLHVTNVDL